MIRSILLHLALLAAAFLLGVAFLLPYELLAERLVFDRIREETGIEVTAQRIVPLWSGGGRAENVLVRLRWKDELVELPIQAVNARVDLLSLFGNRTGGIEMDLAGGTIDLRLEPDRFVLRADRIELERFDPIAKITGWKMTGLAEMTATVDRHVELAALKGDVRLGTRNVTAGGITFLGLDLSEVRLTGFDAEVAIENGRAMIRKAGSSGGNLNFTVEGSVGLATSLAACPLDLLLKIRPGPPIEAAVGKDALRLMTRPDGAVHLGLGGTLEKTALAFR